MKRTLIVSLSIVVLLVLTALPAAAGWTWCSTDPHIKLPDNSLLQIRVAVPQENAEDTIDLIVVAPPGSRLIGGTGRLDIDVTLSATGPAHEVTASTNEAFAVQLSAKRKGVRLGEYTFEPGSAKAVWHW